MTAAKMRVASLLKVEPGEVRPVALVSGLYFFLALSFNFIQAITFGLFIAEFGAQLLPVAYLTIAVLASLVAFGYLKLSAHLPFNRLLVVNLTFIVVVCLVYWLGLTSPARRAFTFLLPFWFQAMINLANLAVWPLAGRLFDLRQAKRLFGLVGIGNWMAVIIGGFIVAPLVGLLGPANLMLLAAIAALAGLLLLAMIRRLSVPSSVSPRTSSPVSSQSGPRAAPAPAPAAPVTSPLKNPYIRLIFAYVLLWWVSFYFIDIIFYDRASMQLPDAALLAGFVGQLTAVGGIVALFTTTFLISRIITRYGLRLGLILMPAIVTLLLAAVAVLGSLSPGSELLFWLASLAKLVNLALGFSLSISASTLLYQPLPVEQRGRAQTMAEGIVQPLAIGLAGLLLLLFNTLLGMRAIQLSYIFLAIAAAWIVAIWRLSRQYPVVLERAISRRRLGETSPDWSDPASRQILQNSLNSRHPADVVFALNRLEAMDASAYRSGLLDAFPSLLAHSSPQVRQEALQRAERLELREVAGTIRQALPAESDAGARAAALKALLSLTGEAAYDQAAAALQDPAISMRRAALVALMQHGSAVDLPAAREAFDRLYRSPDPSERVLAAGIVAEAGASGYDETVLNLLVDEHPEVRRAALRAAGEIRSPRLLPAVVAAAAGPETSRAAALALARAGPSALPAIASEVAALEAGTAAGADCTRQLTALARALGRIGGEQAVALLHRLKAHPADHVRGAALEALTICGARLPVDGQEHHTLLQLEIGQAARQMTVLSLLSSNGADSLLRAALERSLVETGDRVLWLLSLVYASGPILQARAALLARSANQPSSRQAYALELVDTQLPSALKGLVLPLLEPLSPQARLERWRSAGVTVNPASRQAVLIELVFGPSTSAWMRACGLYALGRGIQSATAAISKLITSGDPVLAETARWCVLPPELSSYEGESPMLLTIEKVLILKKVSIFSQVPDEVLADLAQLLEEVEVGENTPIFAKGDLGDSLYMLVDGQVRIHDGSRELQILGEGDLFGEMALLDPEPRSADATSTQATRLLRLAQGPFFELLDEHPEVAAGVIRVLTRRLRARMQDIAEMDSRLKSVQAVQPALDPV